MKVPPGTSGGAKLRLRGKGIAGGDQYLVFKVVVPAGEVDDKSRELIEEFAKRNPQHPRANVVAVGVERVRSAKPASRGSASPGIGP